jgi:hypothetical protein
MQVKPSEVNIRGQSGKKLRIAGDLRKAYASWNKKKDKKDTQFYCDPAIEKYTERRMTNRRKTERGREGSQSGRGGGGGGANYSDSKKAWPTFLISVPW